MPDQRALLLGRLASAIDGVADVASRLGAPAPATETKAPVAPKPPLESVGRPWTLAAAMEPIATPTLERGVPAGATFLGSTHAAPPPPPEHHRSTKPLAIFGLSIVAIILLSVGALHFLSGGAAVQTPSRSTTQILLTGVRPLASVPAAGGTVPATQVSFPAKTSVVDIEVNSGGPVGQAPVHIVVTVGQPAQTIIENDYVLSQSGATVIPLTAVGGTFATGDYTVTITYRGALLGSTAFAVR
jgi:hypothetical protein